MARMARQWAAGLLVIAVLCAVADEGGAPEDPAEGFGAAASGGEGGRLLTVTSLADRGPGSLREALESSGLRRIQFAVEGTIALDRRIRVSSGQLTVDASSAPGDGITIRNHGLWFVGDCDDIVLRSLRIRVLYGAEQGDALLFWGNEGGTVERVLVDHCSLLWATDEVINTWGQCRDISVQWTILAEAQMPHSKGWLSGDGTDRVTIHHCLFAQNADRNPKLQGGRYDLINNVIYNWGANNAAKVDSGARVNVIGNVFRPGPQTKAEDGCVFPDDAARGTRLYLADNVSPQTPTGTEDPWLSVTWFEQAGGRWLKRQPAPRAFCATERFTGAAVTTVTAADAYEQVLASAGARVRDADDRRVVQEVRDGAARTGKDP